MQIKTFDGFPSFTEEQIRIDFEEAWGFIQTIHAPNLNKALQKEVNLKGNGIELAIEVRPLRSDKGQGKRYFGTHYIYRFDDKEKERFFKFYRSIAKTKKRRGVDEYYNTPFCLYFGVYAVDVNVPPVTKKGTAGVVKLATNTAHSVTALPVDLDGVDEEKYLQYKKIFDDAGLKTVVKFTGHGYQIYILLDEPCTNLSAVKQFFDLCKNQLGIEEADDKVIDAARVLRCGGYNSKGVLEGDKYCGISPVIRTETVETTTERYNIQDVFKRLGGEYKPNRRKFNEQRWNEGMLSKYTIETYPYWDEHDGYLSKETQRALNEFQKKKKIADGLKEVAKTTNGKTSELAQLSLKALYPELDIDKMPSGVKTMLYGFREGHADNMLFFLTIKLKYMGYDVETVVKTILTLATLDTYNYAWTGVDGFIDGKVRGVYKSYYKNAKKEDYDKLESEFGSLEIEFSELMSVTKSTKIKIQRSVFTTKRVINEHSEIFYPSVVSKIKPASFVLWLAMIVKDEASKIKNNKQRAFTMDDIIKLTGKDEKNTRKALKPLVLVGLVDKNSDESKKAGNKYLYFVNSSIDWSKGYTLIEQAVIVALIEKAQAKKLKENAVMVYFYLRFRLGNETEIKITQEEIASVLGLDRTSVNKLMKQLEEENLLVIKSNGTRKPNNYILLT